MYDGEMVEFIGPEQRDLPLRTGDRGRMLTCEASYGHVQWLEGGCAGQVLPHDYDDLNPTGGRDQVVQASLNDSLEVASLISLASAQDAYDAMGDQGLVSHLASGGHLASYSSLAEEALLQIVAGLRLDPVLRQLTSTMDPDEADEVYRTAAMSLISDMGDS